MEKLKWLLVGAGDIARKRVAPALRDADNSTISAVVDTQPERARDLAQQYDIDETFEDLSTALGKSSADAVYLATPVYMHVKQAVEALDSGKHVLLEKPLGVNAAECDTAIKAAQNSGLKAGCSYFRRFYPRYKHVDEMLAAGEFGRVVSVRIIFFSWFDPEPDDPKYWRVVKEKSGSGVLSDMGSHMFDVLIGLFGMPVGVYAKCENLVHRWEVEDSAAIIMKLNNGALVTASFGWNSKTWRHEMEIVGTEAKVDWLPYDTGPVVKTVGRDIRSLDMPNADNVHLPVVEDFVEAVLSDRPPGVTFEEAAKTNILLDAVLQSSAERKEIYL